MSELKRTSYDEVPYESHPFPESHPDRLATVATLRGMKPYPVPYCRVMELGCAAGGNLIPMAMTLPESTFLGIDLSGRQIAEGQKVVEALGLKNIELRHANIEDIDEGVGLFHYIICHGVFSWVPPRVQEKILVICKQNLAPQGVAYVSYNTYPGWHMRGMIRDMMRYHANQFTEPKVRVKQARNLLDFMARSVDKLDNPYSQILKVEVRTLGQSADAYLYHEHLEEFNEPVYFHQFAERAAAKGLGYLGDAILRITIPRNYPTEVEDVLSMMSADIIQTEQYVDFLHNRMFRNTLLCHQGALPDYTLSPERLTAFHVASPTKVKTADHDLHSMEFLRFQGPEGGGISLRQPLAKAAMLYLGEVWPRAVPFETLRKAARSRLNLVPEQGDGSAMHENRVLGECLLTAYTADSTHLVELQLSPPVFVLDISERPQASPLARLQAKSGECVTNLRHEAVNLGEFGRHLLPCLDGAHDRAAVVEALVELTDNGQLELDQGGEPTQDAETVRRMLVKEVDQQLMQLAGNALLMGY